MKKNVVSKIGGQAVMEGVMMRGERSMATAVRNAAGEITVESKRFKDTKQKRLFSKIPVVRGVINFVQMMYVGVGITLRSAEVAGEDYEPSGHPRIARFKCEPLPPEKLGELKDFLAKIARHPVRNEIKKAIKTVVPEYTPFLD